jgi:hypothetical protein
MLIWNSAILWCADNYSEQSVMLDKLTLLESTHGARWPNDQAQRPPPETPGRLKQSLPNYLNRPTAQRGGG